jgi:hypothetical protein
VASVCAELDRQARKLDRQARKLDRQARKLDRLSGPAYLLSSELDPLPGWVRWTGNVA